MSTAEMKAFEEEIRNVFIHQTKEEAHDRAHSFAKHVEEGSGRKYGWYWALKDGVWEQHGYKQEV
ncbi:hypothetical protein B0H94_11860 [Salsuginibacillus halophilus]|uniref:Uncharacterized protein n=1 Tax=Salsuginibacillus halophilus TaxID=517424 RepID=A0A2P8H691_9BACI|nr:hypothetical protein [Salsuginibacillus halophilus]PSL41747.1 hypothetical protein B0H94_11860 [Salsuginibacillus halophilus]